MSEVKSVKMIEYFSEHWYKIITLDENNKEAVDYIPSVTTKLNIIAKPFLATWRGDIGNREADMRLFESQNKGTREHHGWYTLTQGGVVIYQPWKKENFSSEELAEIKATHDGQFFIMEYQDEYLDVLKLYQWLGIIKPVVIASEMTVYSLTNRDAGTVDNVFDIEAGKYAVNGSKPLELQKGRYVVDLKSGKQVSDEAFMQVACYAKCLEEMGLGPIDGTLILHTGAKTKSAIEGLSTLYRTKEEVEEDYKDYRLASELWERKNKTAKPKVFEFPATLSIKASAVKPEPKGESK